MKWRIKDLVDKAFEVSYEAGGAGVHRGVHVVFANENLKVAKGVDTLIKIKPIDLPKNHLILIDAYARHPLGNVTALMEEVPKKMDQPRRVTQAAFQPWENGTVEKDDVIGVAIFMLAEIKKFVE